MERFLGEFLSRFLLKKEKRRTYAASCFYYQKIFPRFNKKIINFIFKKKISKQQQQKCVNNFLTPNLVVLQFFFINKNKCLLVMSIQEKHLL